MTTAPTVLKPAGTAQAELFRTNRQTRWWLAPLTQGTLFTMRAVYLFFSGIIWTPLTRARLRGRRLSLAAVLAAAVRGAGCRGSSAGPADPWIPLGFRATCFYYRKAYYRFYFADPPGCAVGEPQAHKRYAMENAFPFILQNVHRYFLYLAFIPLFFLWLDLVPAFYHGGQPRIGLGGVVFLVNVILLTGYSLSCHSLRHILGGRLDCFSCSRRTKVRYSLWQRATTLNRRHMSWAWASLISVTLADVYVRALALGIITDPAIRL